MPKDFKYAGYRFFPTMKMENVFYDMRFLICVRHEKELNDIGAIYSHSKFYNRAKCDADVFECIDNGKFYVPTDKSLVEFDMNKFRKYEKTSRFSFAQIKYETRHKEPKREDHVFDSR